MWSNQSGLDSFRLFPSNDDDTKPQLGFSSLDDSPQIPSPLPPPCIEVLPSQVSSSVKPTLESVNLDGLTLLKLWEGSLDLVKTLRSEVESNNLSLAGMKVLELGCGHGLPGIYSCLQGASAVHFQDFNSEVLQCLTIPNVVANLPVKSQSPGADSEVRFFAGDWSEVHRILPNLQTDNRDSNPSLGYDIILMAETVYSISTLPALYELIKKCMSRPHGVVYMAAKKYYFGVGGGSRRFISLVEKDGVMVASLIAEVGGGSSNVREVWKLQFK
ncbi:histidine protein methyltransferase 1 homolog isoform X2 [Helianthus annuus]|uniref:histidine protein methyltransferase 1 homolog isoform X2 n=1 Tax=Helianthus annuus TaxID=4232 RepID=UPI001652DC6B|nr:histidine protein methyltransferase 1 homolog isoform X2 [Helianthus annuus]